MAETHKGHLFCALKGQTQMTHHPLLDVNILKSQIDTCVILHFVCLCEVISDLAQNLI